MLENFGWLSRSEIRPKPPATADPPLVRFALISIALVFLGLFLFIPVAAVFAEALSKGVGAYFAAIVDPEARSAIALTLKTAAIAVPLNVGFGIAAAWAIARFDFFGKQMLLTLIDLPFSVSPVISGMLFVLLLGVRAPLGGFLADHGVRIIFAEPGIVLATIFVTFPLAARELIPIMQSVGSEEEEAAIVLGAGGWQTFFRVTLPNVKWGLLYGMVLCNARAMGEFGAVSVVSGHIRGHTNTMPLYVEILYNDYQFAAAFAVSSLLTLLAIATLVAKSFLERRVVPVKQERDDVATRVAA
ncbi:MAG TPA: sulfate ABC transporter permease subunit CysW [Candidatus Acidoferrales bacterium]|nr:sulfate ABC transporter permease subunit CysW [Candidatus Acidoferrales bacterium]